MTREGSPKPGHGWSRDAGGSKKPSFSSTADDPLTTAGTGSQDDHDQQPFTGDRNPSSVAAPGTTPHTTTTPAPHAGETEAPAVPRDGETPAMGAPVRPDAHETPDDDERPEGDPEMPALGEFQTRRGPRSNQS